MDYLLQIFVVFESFASNRGYSVIQTIECNAVRNINNTRFFIYGFCILQSLSAGYLIYAITCCMFDRHSNWVRSWSWSTGRLWLRNRSICWSWSRSTGRLRSRGAGRLRSRSTGGLWSRSIGRLWSRSCDSLSRIIEFYLRGVGFLCNSVRCS